MDDIKQTKEIVRAESLEMFTQEIQVLKMAWKGRALMSWILTEVRR